MLTVSHFLVEKFRIVNLLPFVYWVDSELEFLIVSLEKLSFFKVVVFVLLILLKLQCCWGFFFVVEFSKIVEATCFIACIYKKGFLVMVSLFFYILLLLLRFSISIFWDFDFPNVPLFSSYNCEFIGLGKEVRIYCCIA